MQHAAIKAILEESRAVGLSIEDQAVLLATAEVESGFNPMARASTTTACGLFQFVKRTGLAYDLSRQDCMDPHANAAAGIRHYLANYQARVEEKVADLSGAEQLHRIFELSYYLHHDGPESTTHSDAVKAVVLLGTPYLFRAYEILRTEEQQRASYPSFSDEVAKEFRAVTANASVHLPVSLRGALSDDKSISGGNDGDVPSAEDFADIKHSTQGS